MPGVGKLLQIFRFNKTSEDSSDSEGEQISIESDENSDTETEFSKNFPDGDPFDEQPSTSSSNPAATTCSIEVLCENFGKKTVTMAKDRKTEAAGLVFYNLLATLPQNMARLIGHCSEQIIDIMFEQQNEPIEVRAMTYQAFLSDLGTVLEDAYAAVKESDLIGDKYQLSDVASFVEQYVGYWTYPVLFCACEQDVHDELDFRDRISSLEWATKNPEYLHDFDIPDQGQAADFLHRAAVALDQMNFFYTASDKLCNVVSCLRHISQAVQLSSGRPSTGDDLLTLTVFLILKYNPKLLDANVKFIQRFAHSTDLCMHLTGYSYTTLSIAVRKIWELDGAYFGISESDFDKQVGQVKPEKQ